MTRTRRTASRALEVPRALPLSRRRSLVAHHAQLQPVAGVPGVYLHLADDVDPVWRATEEALGTEGAPIPFWAFAWAGGLALARFVYEDPDTVRGLRVLDFATGSGLVAIVAARAGAAEVVAADIDPFAEAAVGMNARANRVHLAFVRRDLLDESPPRVDVITAADTWYEGPLAERVLPWLRAAAAAGTRVLLGDPGRKYLPASGFTELARYDVRTTTTLEDRDVLEARVFTLA
jgi:predicted nicotinamide N-methyase